MKYIMMKHVKTGKLVPIIFGIDLVHGDVAKNAGFRSGFMVRSAGFCIFDSGKFHVSGGSETLGVEHHKEDAAILNKYFGDENDE